MNILIFFAALILSIVLTGLVRHYARRVNLLDIPNQRSSHYIATPRGGGLGVVVVFLGAVICLYFYGDLPITFLFALVFGGVLVAGIGLMDDHMHVAASWRFLVQVMAASFVVAMLGGLPRVWLGDSLIDFGLVGDAMLIVFMVWFTNAFNFMDGIDGIAASEAICIAGGALFILATGDGGVVSSLLVALTAASAGFLLWNWPPAKIFMGDVGSAFLGFVIVAIAILASGDGLIAIWSWLILGGVFIVDATVTLLIRILKREDWLSAHRSHAYQRASRRFESHRRVTIGVIAINVTWLIPIAYAASAVTEYGWWLTIAAWAPLIWLSFWLGAGHTED